MCFSPSHFCDRGSQGNEKCNKSAFQWSVFPATESLDREHLLLSGKIFALGEIDITGSWPTMDWQEAICFEALTIIEPDILAPSPAHYFTKWFLCSQENTKMQPLVQRKQRSRNMSQHTNASGMMIRVSVKKALKWGDLLYRSSREKTDGRMKLEMCKIQINTGDNLAQAQERLPQPMRGREVSHWPIRAGVCHVCCDVTWLGHNKQTYRVTNITSVTQGSHPTFLPHSSCLPCLGTLLSQHMLLSTLLWSSDHRQTALGDDQIIKTIN